MPELIDRGKLKTTICIACSNGVIEIEGCASDDCTLQRLIDDQPTIEAEPVRHGRWNYRHEDDWCYCTSCGTDAEGSDGECLETDYCPHCGARMDGGADNG